MIICRVLRFFLENVFLLLPYDSQKRIIREQTKLMGMFFCSFVPTLTGEKPSVVYSADWKGRFNGWLCPYESAGVTDVHGRRQSFTIEQADQSARLPPIPYAAYVTEFNFNRVRNVLLLSDSKHYGYYLYLSAVYRKPQFLVGTRR